MIWIDISGQHLQQTIYQQPKSKWQMQASFPSTICVAIVFYSQFLGCLTPFTCLQPAGSMSFVQLSVHFLPLQVHGRAWAQHLQLPSMPAT